MPMRGVVEDEEGGGCGEGANGRLINSILYYTTWTAAIIVDITGGGRAGKKKRRTG